MHYFAGAPQACSATILQQGRIATLADRAEGDEGVGPLLGNELHARYEFADGVIGTFDSVARAWEKGDGYGCQLIGTKGVISMRVDVDPVAQYFQGHPFHGGKGGRTWIPITSAGPGAEEPQANLGALVAGHTLALRDLLSAVVENRAPICNAEEGRVIVEMTLSPFASHLQHGSRVTWPRVERGHPLTNAAPKTS
jgi:hypothetical protein